MSNLASRAFEWDFWEIREVLVDVRGAAGGRKGTPPVKQLYIFLKLKERGSPAKIMRATPGMSAAKLLLDRGRGNRSGALLPKNAKILAERKKDSRGALKLTHAGLIEAFLAP